MTRSDLVARVSDLNPHLHSRDVAGAVDAILERIVETLAAGGRVELRDFGIFGIKHREAREGRNPRTGGKVDVPAKSEVVFKPGRAMRARLNPEARQPKPNTVTKPY